MIFGSISIILYHVYFSITFINSVYLCFVAQHQLYIKKKSHNKIDVYLGMYHMNVSVDLRTLISN